ncbi:photoreceptor cilium actin regulator [Stigmatopora argus]
MGCSPSRGNNLVHLGSLRRGRMLPTAPREQPREAHLPDGDHRKCPVATAGEAKDRKTTVRKAIVAKDPNPPPQGPEVKKPDKAKGQTDNGGAVQKNGSKEELSDKKSGKKPRRRGPKAPKKSEKELAKIDFPETLVKAHQAAYAFLNPSVNKYDVVLGLLEQATQTQAFLQPMVSFMALRYEEMIRALEKIADEGEILLRENGEQLAWPRQTKKASAAATAASLKTVSASEAPPDLLQQLLQYTAQRMQNVSQTVAGLGDSALEEAVDYFSSVSELLDEKLRLKRAVEGRITRVASRLELASLRKLGPEDSALFSEDSGIGAESESLAGSEKHHRSASGGSGGTNGGTPVGSVGNSSAAGAPAKNPAPRVSPSASLTSLSSLASICAMMSNAQGESLLGSASLDDGEEDDDEYYKSDGDLSGGRAPVRKPPNPSLEECEPRPRRLPFRRIENPKNVEMTLKMKNALSGKMHFVQAQSAKAAVCPKSGRGRRTEEDRPTIKRSQTTVRRSAAKTKSAANEKRSRSVESLRGGGDDSTWPELKKTGQRFRKINKSKENPKTTTWQNQRTLPADPPKPKHPTLEKDGNLREGFAPLKGATKTQDSSAKQDEDGQKDQKKWGFGKATPPPTPPASPRPPSALYRGRNSVKKLIDTFSQGIEDMDNPDVPGPLKGVRKCGVPVLPGLTNIRTVVNSGKTRTQSDCPDLDHLPPPTLEVLLDNSFESQAARDEEPKPGKSPVVKRPGFSKRLRASVQSGPVLPSKGAAPRCLKGSFPVKDHQETTMGQPDLDPMKDVRFAKSQKVRKIRYLKYSSDSESDKYSEASANRDDATMTQEDDEVFTPETTTTVSQVPPKTATSLQSKGRMLPSTPSISKSPRRRLPSPRNVKKPPTPPSSASPPVDRELRSPPEGQRHLTGPPFSNPSYPFKAPSPPASPRIQRWSRENSLDESPRSFANARSVFCPVSPSMFEAQPRTASQLIQAWTSAGGGFRSSNGRGNGDGRDERPTPFRGRLIRRSLSERSMDLTPRSSLLSLAETFGSEPSVCALGLANGAPRREELWASQSDLSGIPRSASHPDLYVVGQALHPDKIHH